MRARWQGCLRFVAGCHSKDETGREVGEGELQGKGCVNCDVNPG